MSSNAARTAEIEAGVRRYARHEKLAIASGGLLAASPNRVIALDATAPSPALGGDDADGLDAAGNVDRPARSSSRVDPADLPWRECYDAKRQRTYYFNLYTGESRWRAPAEPRAGRAERPFKRLPHAAKIIDQEARVPNRRRFVPESLGRRRYAPRDGRVDVVSDRSRRCCVLGEDAAGIPTPPK